MTVYSVHPALYVDSHQMDMSLVSSQSSCDLYYQVHWTESRSTGTRLGAYTEHYNAEVEYFFKRQVLFGGGILFHIISPFEIVIGC